MPCLAHGGKPKNIFGLGTGVGEGTLGSKKSDEWEVNPGGAERDRTADLVIANDALSQLSYSPQGALAIIWDDVARNAF